MSTQAALIASGGVLTDKQEVRVSAHTHITGLGLKPDGTAIHQASGLIGQKDAREAAGYVVDLIREKKFAGKALLLAGVSGSGKTAIGMAIARELGNKIPFCPMVGSEVFSTQVKKTEILMSNFRRAIGLRIKEMKDIYQGEVTVITPVEGEQQIHGYGRQIAHVLLGLKTTKNQKTLKLDPSIYETLKKQNIKVGDVIHLESATGSVVRLGRCDVHLGAHDISGDVFVPLPNGDVFKQLEVIQELTLHDLDMANAKPSNGSNDIISVIQGITAPRRTEITGRLRGEVNRVVSKYVDAGICEVVPGVLFIDEVHMLDADCHAFLNSALEQPISPVVIVATNRGFTKIRGTDITAAHGIPPDLLDRMMIIRTFPYNQEELGQILKLRLQIEKIQMDLNAVKYMSKLGTQTSLRYILQLLSPCNTIAQTNGRSVITTDDITQATELFLDAKASSNVIAHSDGYMA